MLLIYTFLKIIQRSQIYCCLSSRSIKYSSVKLNQNGLSSSWQCKHLTAGLHIVGGVGEWHSVVVLT